MGIKCETPVVGGGTLMMLMKFSVLVVGLVLYNGGVFGLSEEMQEMANMLHSTCVDETGANEDDILNARKGIFANDEHFKCYIKCIMAQMACIDDDGVIDEEATIAVLPEEFRDKAEPIIKKCGTKKGSSPCENAWLTHKCYQGEAPEDYFLV